MLCWHQRLVLTLFTKFCFSNTALLLPFTIFRTYSYHYQLCQKLFKNPWSSNTCKTPQISVLNQLNAAEHTQITRCPHYLPNPDPFLIIQYLLRFDKRQKEVVLISLFLSHFLFAQSRIVHRMAHKKFFPSDKGISICSGPFQPIERVLPFEYEECCYHCRRPR